MKTKLKLKKSNKLKKPVDKLAEAANLGKQTIPLIVIHDEIERRAAEAGFSDEILEYKYGKNV